MARRKKKRIVRKIRKSRASRPSSKAKIQGLDKLIEVGRIKGRLTYDEINDILPKNVVSSEEIDEVISTLDDENIKLVDKEKEEPESTKIYTPEKPILPHDISQDRYVQTDDPVKMYLRQMGQIPLLTREQEIELAIRIKSTEENLPI